MRKILIFSLTVCLLISVSCSDDDLVKVNTGGQTSATYYKTVSEIQTAVTGVYAVLQGNNLGGREYFFVHDLRSDEFATGGGQLEAHRARLLNGQHAPNNGVFGSVWTGAYDLIMRANAVITLAPLAELLDSESDLRDRLVAEAKFLRAWEYYQLYTLWGDVPLYTTFGTKLDDAQPRTPVAEVVAQILEDCGDAIAELPNSYSGADLGRVTAIAARTLRAKVYMFQGDYTSALADLNAVISYGESTFGNPLMDEYFDNYTEEAEFNKESIWEVCYSTTGGYNWSGDGDGTGGQESWMRPQEYSAVGWRNLIPSDKLLAEFEANDPRIHDNFYFTGDYYAGADSLVLTAEIQNGNTSMFNGVEQKISWKKWSLMYKLDPTGYRDNNGNNHRIFRFADVYLLRAECLNETGGSSAAILADLNMSRNRASTSMPEYPTTAYPCGNQAQILAAIQHERMVELAGEQYRNIDILRWRKNGKLASEPISYFSAKFALLPIPEGEINTNEKINQVDQNPGY